jgi:hypothetical protein
MSEYPWRKEFVPQGAGACFQVRGREALHSPEGRDAELGERFQV